MQDFLTNATFWITSFVLFISLVVCLGGLYALVMQKVIVNEDNEPISIELPLIGRLRTNYPSIAAIFLGIAVALIVFLRWPFPERQYDEMPLVATINILDSESSNSEGIPRTVYVGAIPMKYHKVENVVLPNTPKELKLNVNESDFYYAFAYTVTKIHANGHTEHAVDHGSVKIHNASQSGKHGTFSANLRIE